MCRTLGSQSCANPAEDAKLDQLVAKAQLLVEASPHHLLVQSNAPELSPKLTGSPEPAPGAAQSRLQEQLSWPSAVSLSGSRFWDTRHGWMSRFGCIPWARPGAQELPTSSGSGCTGGALCTCQRGLLGIRTGFLQWLYGHGCNVDRKALWGSRSFATAASALRASAFTFPLALSFQYITH